MKDTEQVLNNIKLNNHTSLLSIVVNKKGAEKAIKFPKIKYLGYPLSISETFQIKNSA